MAAAPAENLPCALHTLITSEDVAAAKQRFPVVDEPFAALRC
jgi:hypothetical protein